ncbi:MAG: hypothetical protein EXS10_04185 [Phycisphaerales bacterium]|nr:hypothetical protein [Phycisphaerales bacterium]
MTSVLLAISDVNFLLGSALVLAVLIIGVLGMLLMRAAFSSARRVSSPKQPAPTQYSDAWTLSGQRLAIDPLREVEFPQGFHDSGDSDSASDAGTRGSDFPHLPSDGETDAGDDSSAGGGSDGGGDSSGDGGGDGGGGGD